MGKIKALFAVDYAISVKKGDSLIDHSVVVIKTVLFAL
jgi:hypothetical protein